MDQTDVQPSAASAVKSLLEQNQEGPIDDSVAQPRQNSSIVGEEKIDRVRKGYESAAREAGEKSQHLRARACAA
jgi:hypothetical protein